MRITLKIKKYPELAGLSPEVIAVIVDEAVSEFLKSWKGITLTEAFGNGERQKNKNEAEKANE